MKVVGKCICVWLRIKYKQFSRIFGLNGGDFNKIKKTRTDFKVVF